MTLEEHRAKLKADKRVVMWCDKNVEDLDRDGVLRALYDFAEMLESERRWNRTSLEMESMFKQAAKALGVRR